MSVAGSRSSTTYLVGEDGVAIWSGRHADAWIGLLETHKQLTRMLDAELEARYGLTLSSLELLARLGAAPDRCLRLSALAAAAGLSLSRVSRIAAVLESRGLIARVPCPQDARAVEAHLTAAGLELMRAAQHTHFDSVQRAFFDRLGAEEIEALASIFGRMAPRAGATCTESSAAESSAAESSAAESSAAE